MPVRFEYVGVWDHIVGGIVGKYDDSSEHMLMVSFLETTREQNVMDVFSNLLSTEYFFIHFSTVAKFNTASQLT